MPNSWPFPLSPEATVACGRVPYWTIMSSSASGRLGWLAEQPLSGPGVVRGNWFEPPECLRDGPHGRELPRKTDDPETRRVPTATSGPAILPLGPVRPRLPRGPFRGPTLSDPRPGGRLRLELQHRRTAVLLGLRPHAGLARHRGDPCAPGRNPSRVGGGRCGALRGGGRVRPEGGGQRPARGTARPAGPELPEPRRHPRGRREPVRPRP